MTEAPEAPRRIDPAAFSTRRELPRRFYKEATAAPYEGGFGVELDGRPVHTPGRRRLGVPGAAFAEALAREWQEQGETINPLTMPLTRLVNAALDGVATNRAEVAGEIVRYAGSDLLCYRTDTPRKLVLLQREIWDPVVRWAEAELGGRFVLSEGVLHATQPPGALESVSRILPHEPIRLAALNLMTTLSGSALLSLAVWKGAISAREAWRAAHIDEEVQEELWGTDREAEQRRELRQKDFDAAAHALLLLDQK